MGQSYITMDKDYLAQIDYPCIFLGQVASPSSLQCQSSFPHPCVLHPLGLPRPLPAVPPLDDGRSTAESLMFHPLPAHQLSCSVGKHLQAQRYKKWVYVGPLQSQVRVMLVGDL